LVVGEPGEQHNNGRLGTARYLGCPSVNLLLGKRRTGKSAFGYRVLEIAHDNDIQAQVLGVPKQKHYLLPDFIEPISKVSEMGDDSAILIDEAYSLFFAREAMAALNKTMAKVMGAVGQKNQILLMATHITRKIDVSCVYEADNLVFKKPSKLHLRMERQEIRDFLKEASAFFEKRPDYRELAYIITGDGTVLVRNRVPAFWSEDLSAALAGVDMDEYGTISGDEDGPIMPLEEWLERRCPHFLECDDEQAEWWWSMGVDPVCHECQEKQGE